MGVKADEYNDEYKSEAGSIGGVRYVPLPSPLLSKLPLADPLPGWLILDPTLLPSNPSEAVIEEGLLGGGGNVEDGEAPKLRGRRSLFIASANTGIKGYF